MGFLIAQLIIYALLLVFAVFMIKLSIANSYEHRISNYSLSSLEDKELSFFDKLRSIYKQFVIGLRKYFKKSDILKKASKRYEKYIIYTNSDERDEEIDFIIAKVIIGCVFIILTLISAIMQTRVVNIWQVLIDFVIGYFILDVYLFYKKGHDYV